MCGPNHLYAEHASASTPRSETESGRCGEAWTASRYTRAPTPAAAATMPGMSGTVPTAFDAAVTAIQRVRSDSTASTAEAGSSSVSGSGSAKRTTAPARSAAISHGRTLASWSRRVHTISSPSASPRAAVAEKRIVSAVIDGPKATPSGAAPSRRPTLARVAATTSSLARACGKCPPSLAVLPERIHSVIASIAASTIWVPPGPSRRAHPSASPGKRSRFTARTARAPGRAGR